MPQDLTGEQLATPLAEVRVMRNGELSVVTTQDLREWARWPDSCGMVPVHPATLNALADALDGGGKLMAEAGALLKAVRDEMAEHHDISVETEQAVAGHVDRMESAKW